MKMIINGRIVQMSDSAAAKIEADRLRAEADRVARKAAQDAENARLDEVQQQFEQRSGISVADLKALIARVS